MRGTRGNREFSGADKRQVLDRVGFEVSHVSKTGRHGAPRVFLVRTKDKCKTGLGLRYPWSPNARDQGQPGVFWRGQKTSAGPGWVRGIPRLQNRETWGTQSFSGADKRQVQDRVGFEVSLVPKCEGPGATGSFLARTKDKCWTGLGSRYPTSPKPGDMGHPEFFWCGQKTSAGPGWV